jgi:hypothetical protein
VFSQVPEEKQKHILTSERSNRRMSTERLLFGDATTIEKTIGVPNIRSVQERVEGISYNGQQVYIGKEIPYPDGSTGMVYGRDDNGQAMITRKGAKFIESLGITKTGQRAR